MSLVTAMAIEAMEDKNLLNNMFYWPSGIPTNLIPLCRCITSQFVSKWPRVIYTRMINP